MSAPETKKLRHEPQKKVKRVCLACDHKFIALGLHNRICPKCKGLESWQRADHNVADFQPNAYRKYY